MNGIVPSVARALFGCGDNGLRLFCHFASKRWVSDQVERCHNDNECQSASCWFRVGRLVVWRDLL